MRGLRYKIACPTHPVVAAASVVPPASAPAGASFSFHGEPRVLPQRLARAQVPGWSLPVPTSAATTTAPPGAISPPAEVTVAVGEVEAPTADTTATVTAVRRTEGYSNYGSHYGNTVTMGYCGPLPI